jgi:hypothetical protein
MASRPSVAPAPLLRADGLTRQVDGRVIVDHVTVELQAGEVLAVVGASGSASPRSSACSAASTSPRGGPYISMGSTTAACPRASCGGVSDSSSNGPGSFRARSRTTFVSGPRRGASGSTTRP